MIVADYSAGFPGAAALKAAGFAGAMRYIGSPGNIKCTTADELRDFDAHGLEMGLVFEQSAGQWRNGYGQGQRDATAARHHASAIDFPLDRPIYFAIDQDVVTEDDFKALDAYADGWASVLGHDLCGPYGEHDVVARCWARGFKWTWQCRAWSGTPTKYFDQRKLFQYYGSPYTADGRNVVVNGIEVDTNEVNDSDWGQHTGGITVDWSDTAREIGDGDTKRPVSYGEMLRSMDDNTGKTRDGIAEVSEKLDKIHVSLSEEDKADIIAEVREGLAAEVRTGLAEELADLIAKRLES